MVALVEQPHALNEKWTLSNASATSDAFLLKGGLYGVDVSATFGGGSVTLERLAADGSTYTPAIAAFTTAGYATASLPPGTYRVAIATASAVYVGITAIARALSLASIAHIALLFLGGA